MRTDEEIAEETQAARDYLKSFLDTAILMEWHREYRAPFHTGSETKYTLLGQMNGNQMRVTFTVFDSGRRKVEP